MKLLTDTIIDQLRRNGERQAPVKGTDDEFDFVPVVKLFTPDAGATWLLTETDPDDPDLAFGLCDLGLGYPELGYVRLSEIASIRGRLGLPAERDRHFTARHTLSVYARAASRADCIVENSSTLDHVAAMLAEERRR